MMQNLNSTTTTSNAGRMAEGFGLFCEQVFLPWMKHVAQNHLAIGLVCGAILARVLFSPVPFLVANSTYQAGSLTGVTPPAAVVSSPNNKTADGKGCKTCGQRTDNIASSAVTPNVTTVTGPTKLPEAVLKQSTEPSLLDVLRPIPLNPIPAVTPIAEK